MGQGENDGSKGQDGAGGAEGGSGEGGENGQDGAPTAPPVHPAGARARVERASPSAELAERISELLAQPHATLMGACFNAGVHYKTVKRWLLADPETANEDLAAFQFIVGQAVERERVRELERHEDDFNALRGPTVAKASALVNKFQWAHTNRFRRVYDEDVAPKQTALELTGKDGGPVQQETAVRYVIMVPEEETED
jgi:hypothetical protein